MIVNVAMTDGSVFQFASRNDLRRVLDRDLAEQDDRTVTAWAQFNTDTREWAPLRTAYLRKHSILYIVAAEDVAESDADLPAKALRDERAAKWAEKHGDEQRESPAERSGAPRQEIAA